MPLQFAKGNFAKSTAGAPVTQTVTLSFAPLAVLVWVGEQTVLGELAASSVTREGGIGFSDGTNHFSIGYQLGTGLVNVVANRRHAAKGCQGYTLYECDIAFSGNNIDFTWTTNNAEANIVHYLAIGGSDITNRKVGSITLSTATGDQAVTDPGFQPDMLFVLCASLTGAPPATALDCVNMIGFAAGTGVFDSSSMCFGGDNGLHDASDVFSILDSNTIKFIRLFDPLDPVEASADALGTFSSFDANGWTHNFSNAPGGAYYLGYLAIKGGQWAALTHTTPLNTGNYSRTGFGFQPTGIMNLALRAVGENAALQYFVYACDGTNQGGNGTLILKNNNAVLLWSRDDETIKINGAEDAVGTHDESSFVSFDANGYTLNESVAGSSAGQGFWAICGGSSPTPVGRRHRGGFV